MKGQSL